MDTPTRLKEIAISDTGFMFDPYTGTTYSTNTVGLTILKGLREGKGRAALLLGLEDIFEVDGHDLNRDIDGFIQQMRQWELLPSHFVLGA